MKNQILYSQSWEDPIILGRALNINKTDSILSITSSGDNTLYLLSKSPKNIVTIDINPYQNYLLELKIAALKELKYSEFLGFIGIVHNKRALLYKMIKNHLSIEARDYWDKNLKEIEKGIIHCGKFEKYLSKFRKAVLPISQSSKIIDDFLKCDSTKKQKKIYNERWDNVVWRLTFHIFFSKRLLKNGRDASFFKYNKRGSLSSHYLNKTKEGLTTIPINSNYFLHYILKGNYDLKNIPDYIKETNFNKIKKNIKRLKIITSDLDTYLSSSKKNRFSKFNLSDVFETMSQKEYEETLQKIVRTSKKGSRICYWNNLVKRNSHPKLNNLVKYNKKDSKKLFKEDRIFFYNDFIIESVNKAY